MKATRHVPPWMNILVYNKNGLEDQSCFMGRNIAPSDLITRGIFRARLPNLDEGRTIHLAALKGQLGYRITEALGVAIQDGSTDGTGSRRMKHYTEKQHMHGKPEKTHGRRGKSNALEGLLNGHPRVHENSSQE
ncbi:Fc.00g030950.m01.CDS01 [Cosmosporella sp. VM-42]